MNPPSTENISSLEVNPPAFAEPADDERAGTPDDEADIPSGPTFASLGLNSALLGALEKLGYERPTGIQVEAITPLLAGRDVQGQARTGTGKTAAFGLPLLQRLNLKDRSVQALILVPTRELAVQVTEALCALSKGMGDAGVLAIYGGDSMTRQLRRLAGTVRVVVGTPGRVLDHLGRGSLRLDGVKTVVLDEADEMLKMGFADEVEAILAKAPKPRQTALFSATFPDEIARIARESLVDPITITVEGQERTVETLDQRYLVVAYQHRLDALARVLEVEGCEAALVFASTRVSCAEIADQLEARGIAAEALHGDMAQTARESVVRRLKRGQLRVVVATDVAARGLDVDRLTLVVNLEMPKELEVYVHRVGRTGRAGRAGMALLFLEPSDGRRLEALQHYTGKELKRMKVPTPQQLSAARLARCARAVTQAAEGELGSHAELVEKLKSLPLSETSMVAALAKLAFGEAPFAQAVALPDLPFMSRDRPRSEPRQQKPRRGTGGIRVALNLGAEDRVTPRDLVGAIANEAGVPGRALGTIEIRDTWSVVEVDPFYLEKLISGMQGVSIRRRLVELRVMDAPVMPRKPARASAPEKVRGPERPQRPPEPRGRTPRRSGGR